MGRGHVFQFWLTVLGIGAAAVFASIVSLDDYWFAILLGLGLGFMILALFVLGVTARDEREAKARQREIRHVLAASTQAGQRVISLCHAADKVRAPAPENAKEEWAQHVFDYLQEELGADYAVRFDNPAGLPMGITVLAPEYHYIESYVKSRLARLNEFIKELAV